ATVKASLVFLRKFTDAATEQWEAAWTQAHAELDAGFDAQRNAAHDEYAPRLLSGDDADAARLLEELAALGLQRVLLAWQRGEAHREHKTAAAELKMQAAAALPVGPKRSDALLSALKARYKAIDAAHTAALWARVRELFDCPLFVAATRAVGITSTGATGEGV